MATNIDELKKVKESLKFALSQPYSELIRDATIQRFEFCIELSWKTIKKKWVQPQWLPKLLLEKLPSKA